MIFVHNLLAVAVFATTVEYLRVQSYCSRFAPRGGFRRPWIYLLVFFFKIMLRLRLTALGRSGFVRVLEARILVESTLTLRLEDIFAYEEAETGDCIVQVPEVRREYATCFRVSIRGSTYPQTKITCVSRLL